MNSSGLAAIEPDILGAPPAFKGQCAPVKPLFERLADGHFRDEPPGCSRFALRETARFVEERLRAMLLEPFVA